MYYKQKMDIQKWTSKTSYMSQKIFDNDLVAICKNKVNKPAYIRMYILELSKLFNAQIPLRMH